MIQELTCNYPAWYDILCTEQQSGAVIAVNTHYIFIISAFHTSADKLTIISLLAALIFFCKGCEKMNKDELIEQIIQKWVDMGLIVLKSDDQYSSQPQQPQLLKAQQVCEAHHH